MTFRPVVRNPLLATAKGANTAVFQRPSLVGAENPATVPDVFCTYANVNLGGFYFVRIKRTPGVEYKITGIGAPIGVNNSGAPVNAAMAVYVLVTEDGWARMRRIEYHAYTVPNGTDFGETPYADGFFNGLVLAPDKHYIFMLWVGAAACAVTGSVHYVIDPLVVGSVGTSAAGRAYSASESSDQPVFKTRASDPYPGLALAADKDIIVHAIFYHSGADVLIY